MAIPSPAPKHGIRARLPLAPPPRHNIGWTDVPPLAAAIALGFGLLGALWLLGRALALLVLAATLASALEPVASWVSRRVRYAFAVIAVYLTLLATIGVLAAFVVPNVSQDLSRLATQLPGIVDQLRNNLVPRLQFSDSTLVGAVRDLIPRIVNASSQLASGAVDVLVVLFLSLYLLLSARAFQRFVGGLIPRRNRRRVLRIAARIGREMGGYFRGAAINGLIVAGMTWCGLRIIGVDYAGPLAILAFFGELVPYLGPVVVALPALAVALLQSVSTAVAVGIAYLAIQQIEGHVLTPLIMHSQTHISPAMVIIALTVGYTVGGIVGALAAIPLFAAGRVLILTTVAPRLRRRAVENGTSA